MSADDDLAALKARRDMDRLTLMDRLAEARELANPKVLAARARVDVQERARSAAHQALEIANDHRGVVAATVSALALWAMRGHAGKSLAERFGPATVEMGKRIVEKAAPVLLAPFTSPFIAALAGPLLGAIMGRGRRDAPVEERED